MTFLPEADDFHVHRCEIYWPCRKKLSESVFSSALLEKTIGMLATMRSANAVKNMLPSILLLGDMSGESIEQAAANTN